MKIRDIMTAEIQAIPGSHKISTTADIMAKRDIGIVPVTRDNELVGVVTDRDITVRAVAKGMSSDTPVDNVMTLRVITCRDDEQIDHVAAKMADFKIRRMPVVDRHGAYVGIISLGDIATTKGPDTAGEALEELSLPGERHLRDRADWGA